MKIGKYIFCFLTGFVLGAYGYKYYLDQIEDVEYDIGDKIIDFNKKTEENNTKIENEEIIDTPNIQNEEIINESDAHPQDSDEDEEYDEYDEDTQKRFDEGWKMTNNYYQNRDRPPEILSIYEASNLDTSVDNEIVYYYYDNGYLAFPTRFAENEEIIENESYYFGDCLKDFCDDKSKERIFIMNYNLNTLYEVKKIYGSHKEDLS